MQQNSQKSKSLVNILSAFHLYLKIKMMEEQLTSLEYEGVVSPYALFAKVLKEVTTPFAFTFVFVLTGILSQLQIFDVTLKYLNKISFAQATIAAIKNYLDLVPNGLSTMTILFSLCLAIYLVGGAILGIKKIRSVISLVTQ